MEGRGGGEAQGVAEKSLNLFLIIIMEIDQSGTYLGCASGHRDPAGQNPDR
jgi:hypothetical protein